MCGIAGFLDLKRAMPGDRLESLARAMADSMLHRGPDAGGVFVHPEAGLAISHRRLSIVDLSPAGAQPMTSADGRFVIVYNGEIYTGDELRRDLAPRGIAFRGHSDTEAILEGCAAWGVDAVLPRLIGMFAFALWDKQTRTLTLVRDRLGIKPVYWGRCGDTILFGSELKSLRAHPAFTGTIDPDAVASFLRFSYVPAPHSIYRNIYKLPPGHTLTIDAGGNTRLKSFWNLAEITAAGQTNPDRRSREDILSELEPLLEDAVGRRMIAPSCLAASIRRWSSRLCRRRAGNQCAHLPSASTRKAITKPSMRRRWRGIWGPNTPSFTLIQRMPRTSFRACRNGMTSPSPMRHRSQPSSCRR